MSRPVAAILTLGCKLNIADSEELARGFRRAGYDVVDRICDADAYVVNTCSVTHVADAKSRRLIRAVQRASPGAPVAVTGCYPQSAGFDAITALGADFVAGTRDADKAALIEFVKGRRPSASSAESARAASPGGLHTRAFVKAQEGCNDVCAFCIVPQTRGREESRSIAQVTAEVARAVESGAREVVITGTQLGAWGRDLSEPLSPADLIAGILEGTDVLRLRFSSLQPQDITPQLLALWEDPRLMPHFHLALQAGSDLTLRAMRRRYTIAGYRDAAARIRAVIPSAAITTDVIAGFPGESEADFEETLAFCEEMAFARVHCFPYSRRSRTTAARSAGQNAPPVIHERMQRLLALAERLSTQFRISQQGAIRSVLWEGERKMPGGTFAHGYTDNYVPVYGNCKDLTNRATPVVIGAVYHDGVWGTLPGEAL
jgi:threonylcarbamoyladenosine tRNA methylthiotransferase MtaB